LGPTEDLSAVEHTILEHPSVPDHGGCLDPSEDLDAVEHTILEQTSVPDNGGCLGPTGDLGAVEHTILEQPSVPDHGGCLGASEDLNAAEPTILDQPSLPNHEGCLDARDDLSAVERTILDQPSVSTRGGSDTNPCCSLQGWQAPSSEQTRDIGPLGGPQSLGCTGLIALPGHSPIPYRVVCDGKRFVKHKPPGMETFERFLENALPHDSNYSIIPLQEPRYFRAGIVCTNHDCDDLSPVDIASHIESIIEHAMRLSGQDVKARPFGKIKVAPLETQDPQHVSLPDSSRHGLQDQGGDTESCASDVSPFPSTASEFSSYSPANSSDALSVAVPAMLVSQVWNTAMHPSSHVAFAVAPIDPELQSIFMQCEVSEAVQDMLKNDGVTQLAIFSEYVDDVAAWAKILRDMDPSITHAEVAKVKIAFKIARQRASKIIKELAFRLRQGPLPQLVEQQRNHHQWQQWHWRQQQQQQQLPLQQALWVQNLHMHYQPHQSCSQRLGPPMLQTNQP